MDRVQPSVNDEVLHKLKCFWIITNITGICNWRITITTHLCKLELAIGNTGKWLTVYSIKN